MTGSEVVRTRWTELLAAFGLLTRFPFASFPLAAPASSVWAFPIVGAMVGAIGGFAFWITIELRLPAVIAAIFALGATILVTGALHEDGLADAADALGGTNREQRLAIMRDHRIGTYGVIALTGSLGLRVAAVALLATPDLVSAALIASGAVSRAAAAVIMAAMPNARGEGLSAAFGRPSGSHAAAAAVIAYSIACLLFPFATAFSVLTATLIAGALVGWAASNKLGGQTGDVLGAACQLAECLALCTILISFG